MTRWKKGIFYLCVGRWDPGDYSPSFSVTHTLTQRHTWSYVTPCGPPPSDQRAADWTPQTRLIHNAHREITLSLLVPSSTFCLAKAMWEMKKTSPWSQKNLPIQACLLVMVGLWSHDPHIQGMQVWTHCALSHTHTRFAHVGFICAHLSNAKLRHEPSRRCISLLVLMLVLSDQLFPSLINHALHVNWRLSKMHVEVLLWNSNLSDLGIYWHIYRNVMVTRAPLKGKCKQCYLCSIGKKKLVHGMGVIKRTSHLFELDRYSHFFSPTFTLLPHLFVCESHSFSLTFFVLTYLSLISLTIAILPSPRFHWHSLSLRFSQTSSASLSGKGREDIDYHQPVPQWTELQVVCIKGRWRQPSWAWSIQGSRCRAAGASLNPIKQMAVR